MQFNVGIVILGICKVRRCKENKGMIIGKGATLQNMGRFKLAVRSYDKALLISPDSLDALLNKGSALHSAQNYEKAIECYDTALQIDKKCAMD